MSDEELRALAEKDPMLARAEAACRPCGPCDAGLPMGCNCDPEPRVVIAALLDRLARVEALADQWNETPDYNPSDYNPSDYDQGRVDQRHDMTLQLLAALSEPTTRTTDPEESTR